MLYKSVLSLAPWPHGESGTWRASVGFIESDSEGPARDAKINVFITPQPGATLEDAAALALRAADEYIREFVK